MMAKVKVRCLTLNIIIIMNDDVMMDVPAFSFSHEEYAHSALHVRTCMYVQHTKLSHISLSCFLCQLICSQSWWLANRSH